MTDSDAQVALLSDAERAAIEKAEGLLLVVGPIGRDPTLREALRAAIFGESGADGEGLTHWHQASGGTSLNAGDNDRAGVFVDRSQVLEAIDRVLDELG